MTKIKKSLTYRDAGVDIHKADALVDDISQIAKKTHRPGVLSGIGGFGGLFEIPTHYKQPVLVSGTDGVGTKLKIAIEMQHLDSIGIDLVAMCANDVVTAGAEPLFFLDYYATGKLEPEQATAVITGISRGCEMAGMALIGGETAEMPGLYRGSDFDIAGFCVGVVEKEKIIDASRVRIGDALIALASSGPHSNGYSLIRKIISSHHTPLTTPFEGDTLGNVLLAPTRVYVKSILHLLPTLNIHAIAHITGGGLLENIPRVLPAHTQAVIKARTWTRPPIFDWLQQQGGLDEEEMWRTFNLGVGMIIGVAPQDVEQTIEQLTRLGERAWQIGHIEKSTEDAPRTVISQS